MAHGLKLTAEDADDLTVVASCLQDALIAMQDMAYLPAEARFAFVANRFCWEKCCEEGSPETPFERVHTGIHFDNVKSVRVRNLDQKNKDAILSLLTVRAEEGTVDLLFAGGGVIRLEVDGIACRIEDIDEPWPTKWQPNHAEGSGVRGNGNGSMK
jgi:hypothetical protein